MNVCSKQIDSKITGTLCFYMCGFIFLIYIFNENSSRLFAGNYEKEFAHYSLKHGQVIPRSRERTLNENVEENPKADSIHVPDLILQYGIARTATTLQFQILCLMMAFLHEDEIQNVGCTHYRQENKKYIVIKTHRVSDFLETSLPLNTWIFMTSNRNFSEHKRAIIQRNRRKIDAKNLRIPLIADIHSVIERGHLIVYDYQTIFGISDDKMQHIVDYLRYWDTLRVCCGLQMSAKWRKHLFTNSQERKYNEIDKPTCWLHDIAQIEQKLIETYAYKRFAADIEAIGKLSVVDGKLNGSYCKRCNENIAKRHLKFNAKCTW